MFSKINNFVKNVAAEIRGILRMLASDFQEPYNNTVKPMLTIPAPVKKDTSRTQTLSHYQ